MQNPRRTGVRESLKAHALESLKTLLKRTLITCNGKYTEHFRGKTETKRKKLAALHPVVFQVVFSLLAFLGPLESYAVEKMRGMSLQYPRRMSRVSK